MPDADSEKPANRYKVLIERVFFDRYAKGGKVVEFQREDIEDAARTLGLKLPKNIGDVLYSIRYRTGMPERILATQPKGKEWIIEGLGRSRYAFKLERTNRIVPNRELVTIKVPDSTPEIIGKYALSDEQALLAKVRYNRLVDVFLGIAAYSLQNHLRTTVSGVGQIEIDEVYVGVDRHGCQYVLPVQAKGGTDQLSAVQTRQDIACCKQKFPGLVCRAISAQFMAENLIAIFELVEDNGEIKVVEEKHYRLVAADDIGSEDLRIYAQRR